MGKCFVDPNALLAVAGMLAAMANGDTVCVGKEKPTRKTQPCGCNRPTPPRDAFGRFVGVGRPVCPTPPPAPRWGVCECEPREDKNKVFGLSVRVDEPRREQFCSNARFLDARRKWDNLVDAVEAVDWPNKSNTAPLHKVNAIRRRVEDGPVFGINLVGETHWF
jgi:hypothetical protein